MKAKTKNKGEDKMKRIVFLSLVCVLILPLVLAGCGEVAKVSINLTLDDFANQNNIVKDVAVSTNGEITVTLGSNGSTGYQWGDAVIDNATKIEQASHIASAAQGDKVGAAGKEIFTLKAKAAGSATIKLSYSRPWEGGEKDTYTLTINVTVK
jgi:predicted secreted protein